MTQVAIITLSPSQWQMYKTLRLEALQSDPQAFGRSFAEEVLYPDEKWQERLAGISTSSVYSYFASIKDKLVGMVGAKIIEEGGQKVAVVMQMYVQKNQRGKGIGQLLLLTLLKELQKRSDIVSVQLDVNTSQKNAIKLYQKMGFTIIKETKRLMGDGDYHDEYVMEINTASISFQ